MNCATSCGFYLEQSLGKRWIEKCIQNQKVVNGIMSGKWILLQFTLKNSFYMLNSRATFDLFFAFCFCTFSQREIPQAKIDGKSMKLHTESAPRI